MEKISIVIPVYNVEPFMRRCLDSVINQTYTNLEIICVDDGSTDRSGEICDEYTKHHQRVKTFHKENGGLSSALNLGLKNCSGTYVGFVDSDDWIEPNMYETLHKVIKDKNVPISVASYFIDDGAQSKPVSNKKTILDETITQKDMLLYPLKRDDYKGFCGYVWNKLYLAELFINSGLTFDGKIKYGMDILFYTSLILTCKCTGAYCDEPLYHYYQRDTAISKSSSMDIKLDILTVYKRVEELLIDNGYEDISFWARGFYCHHASVIAEIALKNNDTNTLTSMQHEIKKHLNDYIKTNSEFPDKFDRINKLLNA